MILETIRRFFSPKKETETLHECSIADCHRATPSPFDPDPRLRWLVGVELKDDNGKPVKLTLCPPHAKMCLGIGEEFFLTLEKTEEKVRATWV